jgi:aminoglycoside phosphotransferase family enzyme
MGLDTADCVQIREADFAATVEALRSASAYPHPVGPITVIETHFAWVFLAGEYAYKLKKPLGNPDVDLRGLSARRMSCVREVELNRRLAPDVYLGVVPITRTAGQSVRVDATGPVADWLIRMRRLPAEAMLDRSMIAHTVPLKALEELGVLLARFYRGQPRVRFTPRQYIVRLGDQIHADRHALLDPRLRLDEPSVQRAFAAAWDAFVSVKAELAQRAAEDRIVEAHGDLRPEHICLEDPPRVIDALDFSKDLRTLDPAEEISYLWMECDWAGDVSPAVAVLSAYRRESGDPVSERLLDFYRSRRAFVRAKIVAWHLLDPAAKSVAPWRDRAHAYVALALRYARGAMAEG